MVVPPAKSEYKLLLVHVVQFHKHVHQPFLFHYSVVLSLSFVLPLAPRTTSLITATKEMLKVDTIPGDRLGEEE